MALHQWFNSTLADHKPTPYKILPSKYPFPMHCSHPFPLSVHCIHNQFISWTGFWFLGWQLYFVLFLFPLCSCPPLSFFFPVSSSLLHYTSFSFQIPQTHYLLLIGCRYIALLSPHVAPMGALLFTYQLLSGWIDLISAPTSVGVWGCEVFQHLENSEGASLVGITERITGLLA